MRGNTVKDGLIYFEFMIDEPIRSEGPFNLWKTLHYNRASDANLLSRWYGDVVDTHVYIFSIFSSLFI